MKDGLPQVIDIWMSKVQNYGWKIEDAPNEVIKKELRKRLRSKNGQQQNTGKKDNITLP